MTQDRQPCPWCEGRGTTARVVYGEMPQFLTVFGMPFHVRGCLMDRPCGRCGGTGKDRPVGLETEAKP